MKCKNNLCVENNVNFDTGCMAKTDVTLVEECGRRNSFEIKFDQISKGKKMSYKKYYIACVIAAWCEGELSEGQAARRLGINRVQLREFKIKIIKEAVPGYGDLSPIQKTIKNEGKIMTREQKSIIEPVAIVLAGINEDLENKEKEELEVMLAACEAATKTNCWTWIYQSAQYLKPILNEKIYRLMPPLEKERLIRG